MHEEPKIINKNSFKVVGMKYLGKNKNNELLQLWSNFKNRLPELDCIADISTLYGVYEPPTDLTLNSNFSYMVSVEMQDLTTLPEGMRIKTIPANTYAVFKHVGGTEILGKTYEYIYGNWLPKSQYVHSKGPDFEVYDNAHSKDPYDLEISIYVPIR